MFLTTCEAPGCHNLIGLKGRSQPNRFCSSECRLGNVRRRRKMRPCSTCCRWVAVGRLDFTHGEYFCGSTCSRYWGQKDPTSKSGNGLCLDCGAKVVRSGPGRVPRRCRPCTSEYEAQREAKRSAAKYRKKKRVKGHTCHGDGCSNLIKGLRRKYCEWCRDERAAKRDARYRNSPKGAAKRQRERLRRFNISQGEYDLMVAAQNNLCGCCGAADPGGQGTWCIDHDRRCCPGDTSCGKCVRALLCNDCNLIEGRLRDVEHARRMYAYKVKWERQTHSPQLRLAV